MGTQAIFATPPQHVMDLGQTIQHSMEFPATLAERYQPRRVEDFIGIERVKRFLGKLMAQPRACSLLFVGPPGAGKTTVGMALAEQMPGSLVHVSAQKCDVAMLDSLHDRFAYSPPVGKFWICLVDEIDQSTEKAQLQLLSRLDGTASLKPQFGGAMERGTPPPVIWIFTTNGRGVHGVEPPPSLAPRFISRCMTFEFHASTRSDLAAYLEKVWLAEGGEPMPAAWFEYMANGVGVRDALMRLDVDLMAGPREIVKAISPTSTTSTVAKDCGAARSNAALKAWATRRANMNQRKKGATRHV